MKKDRAHELNHATVETVTWHGHVCLPMNQAVEFIDDVTAERSSRTNSAVYRTILFAQIQSNAAKLKGWHFTVMMNNYPQTYHRSIARAF